MGWLGEQLGLDVENLDRRAMRRALTRCMRKLEVRDMNALWRRMLTSAQARQMVIDAMIVPESWFFRYPESYALLGEHLAARNGARLLSVPCAAGEEPYSMAIAVLERGLSAMVDAVDVSAACLARARAGSYGARAFRGTDASWRARYFDEADGRFVVKPRVRRMVRFHRANVLERVRMLAMGKYDAIFCRNLLIYLAPAKRSQVIDLLCAMLNEDGLLFVGHGEMGMIEHPELVHLDKPQAFALRRRQRPLKPVVEALPRVLPSQQVGRKERALRGSDDLGAHLQRASRMADQGCLEQASALCDQCLALRPDWPEAWLLRAMIDSARQRPRAAEKALRKVLYLAPDHEEALLHLASLLEQRGHKERAELLRRRVREAS